MSAEMELSKMITYKKVDRTYFPQYDHIPRIVSAYCRIDKDNYNYSFIPII